MNHQNSTLLSFVPPTDINLPRVAQSSVPQYNYSDFANSNAFNSTALYGGYLPQISNSYYGYYAPPDYQPAYPQNFPQQYLHQVSF